MIIVGFRPYAVLLDALRHVAGAELAPGGPVPTAAGYRHFWREVTGRLTDREIAEACGIGAGAPGTRAPTSE